jgi:hypothetical protein
VRAIPGFIVSSASWPVSETKLNASDPPNRVGSRACESITQSGWGVSFVLWRFLEG